MRFVRRTRRLVRKRDEARFVARTARRTAGSAPQNLVTLEILPAARERETRRRSTQLRIPIRSEEKDAAAGTLRREHVGRTPSAGAGRYAEWRPTVAAS